VRNSAKRFSVLVVSLLCLSLVYSEAAYSASREDAVVTAVRTRNNRVISTETILSRIKVRPGDRFNQEALNDDLRRLYATEFFSDVAIDVEGYQDGLAVTFIVEEKAVINQIVFEGNAAFRENKLKAAMKSKVDDMLNMAILAQDMTDIKDLYVKKGYPLVEVNYEIDMNKAENKARIIIKINEKTRVKITRVDIAGNKAIKSGVIRKMLGTKPAWLFNAGVFKDDVLQDDVDRIRSLYDDKGYLDVRVDPQVDFSEDRKTIVVDFNITEGKQYMVGAVVVTGDILLPEKDVRAKIMIKPGKPFSNKSLRMDLAEIKSYYYRYGYMNAVIDVDRTLNPTTGDIDVTFLIDPKNPVTVGMIDIRGNTKTRDIVVRRELRIYPGERFDGDKIRRSKERLYNLGFFEDILFDTEPTENPDVMNLAVTVKESKTGEFSFGGGYSSIDQLIGFVAITQKNFDILNFPSFMGGGQQLNIRADIGMVRNNFSVGWQDPWIFGFPYLFGFDAYRQSHDENTDVGWPYNEVRTGFDARLGKEFTEHFRGDLVYRLENIVIGDIVDNASQDLLDEEGTKNVSSLTLELTYDTRDNIYNPKRGFIVAGSLQNAGGFLLGDRSFVKGTGTAACYFSFFNILVLELKVRGGLSNAYGNTDEVPIYERFFAGGANTIRGYKERRVGPRDSGSDEPIGGEAITVGNAELTFPIYEGLIKGAVFYDIGNVWRRAEEFMVGGNYKSGAGVGVRVKTPIGPVKLDYGYPLEKHEGESKWGELYFSMSHGF